jgi:hypothetical protein
MDCTDLNSDEAVSYFRSAFPSFSSSKYDEYDDLKEAIYNPIIIDTLMGQTLNLPDIMAEKIARDCVGVLTNKNPLLVYTYAKALKNGKLNNGQIYIHKDFRGFLINDMYVIYCGDNYKCFFNPSAIYAGKSNIVEFDVGAWGERNHRTHNEVWMPFASPLMIDITELVCGNVMNSNFLNWPTRNPMEVK